MVAMQRQLLVVFVASLVIVTLIHPKSSIFSQLRPTGEVRLLHSHKTKHVQVIASSGDVNKLLSSDGALEAWLPTGAHVDASFWQHTKAHSESVELRYYGPIRARDLLQWPPLWNLPRAWRVRWNDLL